MIGLIALLSAFVPHSTAIYLPSLPGMAKYFGVSSDLANLSLILFLVFFSAGTLFWGPLSGKYGREPIFLVGLVLYVVASISCADAWNIYVPIGVRYGGSALQVMGPPGDGF